MTTMNPIRKNDTRAINGGSYLCARCRYRTNSKLGIQTHIVTKHTKELLSYIGKKAESYATLLSVAAAMTIVII